MVVADVDATHVLIVEPNGGTTTVRMADARGRLAPQPSEDEIIAALSEAMHARAFKQHEGRSS